MKRVLLLAALLVLVLGGCGFTPGGDFVREAVKAKGAQAYDEGLKNAEWYMCQAASIGSVKRRYGGGMADAYNVLCDKAGAEIIK